jgi:hypothetical protein
LPDQSGFRGMLCCHSNCCCFRDPWRCRRIYFASPYQVVRGPCGWPYRGLQWRTAVNAMPTDPWGQPLTPGCICRHCIVLFCFCSLCSALLRTPAHGLARQLQTHARPISFGAWWLEASETTKWVALAWHQARLAPLATRANFFSPICGG